MTRLFDEVLEDAARTGSRYRDICRCRDDLLGFLDVNGWFGQEPVNCGLQRPDAFNLRALSRIRSFRRDP